MIGRSVVNSASNSGLAQSLRMLLARLQRHQIDHVHHAHFEIRQMPVQQIDRRESLERRHVPRAGHDHVG